MISERNQVALVIGCGYFMMNLDTTILKTALPEIAKTFGADPVHLNVVITGYLVSFAVCIPVSGWLANRYGARTVFRTALAIFVVTSALCGLSDSVLTLTGARIIQGMSVAVVVPVGRLVLLRSVKKSEIVKATVFLTVPAQSGAVLGPVLGGLITTYASWRWIFLINVPIGPLGLCFATRLIENYREATRRPFDWLGFLFIALSVAGLLFSLEAIGRGNTPVWQIVAFLSGSLAIGAVAVRHATRTQHP